MCHLSKLVYTIFFSDEEYGRGFVAKIPCKVVFRSMTRQSIVTLRKLCALLRAEMFIVVTKWGCLGVGKGRNWGL